MGGELVETCGAGCEGVEDELGWEVYGGEKERGRHGERWVE
jgi:hypothetical protein